MASQPEPIAGESVPDTAASSASGSKTRRPLPPLHPWLFAVFPVISLYSANRHEVIAGDIVRPLMLVLALATALWLAVWALLRRDLARSAVVTSVLLFWIFTYGRIESIRQGATDILAFVLPNAYDISPAAFALTAWGVGLALILLLAWRFRRGLGAASGVLSAIGLALIATASLPLIRDMPLRSPGGGGRSPSGEETEWGKIGPAQPPTAASPDIYFIVLDAYGRGDILKHYYGLDNEPFLSELRKRGFFVPRRSRANYDQTIQCLSTALGMRYLDDLAAKQPPGNGDLTPITQRIDRSPVAAFLKNRGYRYINISSGFPLTRAASADLLLEGEGQSDGMTPFESLVMNLTPLGALPRVRGSLYDRHRARLDDAWRYLSDLPRREPERKFVFTHILAPHPPFVFGANGEPLTPRQRTFSLEDGSVYLHTSNRDDYRQGYAAQLKYVNKRTLAAIDAIFASSRVKPVIILIGDHGPRMFLDYDSLERTDPRECFSNLSALYLPDGSASKVYDDAISPVNDFRLLFDHYFDARLPRLPDRSYYSRSGDTYHFTDITDRTSLPSSEP